MQYLASNYTDRTSLDRALANRTPEEDDIIQGSYEELSKLSLKQGKKVYGVPVQEL